MLSGLAKHWWMVTLAIQGVTGLHGEEPHHPGCDSLLHDGIDTSSR